MRSSPPLRRLRVLAQCLCLALGTTLSSIGEPILRESPFMPPPGTPMPAAQGEQPPAAFELRGIMTVGGQLRFSVLNTSTRKSAWVGLDEPGEEFRVRAFDPDTDTVTLDHAGRTLSLPLAQAKIQPLAMPPTPSAANLQPNLGPGGAMPTPGNVTPADEARRLEAVAAEVRRRRALRQAAAQQQPPPPAPARP